MIINPERNEGSKMWDTLFEDSPSKITFKDGTGNVVTSLSVPKNRHINIYNFYKDNKEVEPHQVVISGSAYIGSTLTSTESAQWLLNGEPIDGATGDTLTVPESVLVGDEITQAGSNVLEVTHIPTATAITVDTALGLGNSFSVPTKSDRTYDCVIYWGDRTSSVINSYDSADLSHSYSEEGEYHIQIEGEFGAFYFNDGGDKDKLTRVDNWGENSWSGIQEGAFFGCSNLSSIDNSFAAWANTNLFYMLNMFNGCASLTSLPPSLTLENVVAAQTSFVGSGFTALPEFLNLESLEDGFAMFESVPLIDLPSDVKLPNLFIGEVMFSGSTFPTSRYSQLLLDLESGNSHDNVTFHGGGSVYNHDGWVSKTILEGRGWTFTDGGIAAEITGTPELGGTLSSEIAGQWYVNGVPVEGETGTEFEIPLSLVSGDEIWNEWTISMFVFNPVPPVLSGDAYQGQDLTSTSSGEWLINGSPTGVVSDTFTVPESVLMGDEISQAGSNVLTVMRIPLAIGINVNTELAGVTSSDGFRIPARNDTGYDCRVYWGDGTYSDINAYNHPDLEHTYEDGGVYDIQISGTFRGFYFNNGGDKDKILRIDQWGDTGQATIQTYAFRGCVNLTTLPDDMTLSNLTDGNFMFFGTSITTLPDDMTLPNLINGANMFANTSITTTRYSQLLIDMDATNPNSNVSFHGGNAKYNEAGAIARAALIGRGWTITDGGPA